MYTENFIKESLPVHGTKGVISQVYNFKVQEWPMKTNYSENYSPQKLLLRVAIIVFETLQYCSNLSSVSHAQQLLTLVSLELCTCGI